MTEPQATTPSDAFAELGRIDFRETDVATALTKVADLARRTVPGADDVSVTLVGAEGGHTAAFTGQQALTVDEWQYQKGHGPCLAAAAANITVSVPDMAADDRWPDWADRAVEAGRELREVAAGLTDGAAHPSTADPSPAARAEP